MGIFDRFKRDKTSAKVRVETESSTRAQTNEQKERLYGGHLRDMDDDALKAIELILSVKNQAGSIDENALFKARDILKDRLAKIKRELSATSKTKEETFPTEEIPADYADITGAFIPYDQIGQSTITYEGGSQTVPNPEYERLSKQVSELNRLIGSILDANSMNQDRLCIWCKCPVEDSPRGQICADCSEMHGDPSYL